MTALSSARNLNMSQIRRASSARRENTFDRADIWPLEFHSQMEFTEAGPVYPSTNGLLTTSNVVAFLRISSGLGSAPDWRSSGKARRDWMEAKSAIT